MTQYIYTSPIPGELSTGRPLIGEDVIDLDTKLSTDNAELIDSGRLLEIPEAPKKTQKRTSSPSSKTEVK